ncbi:MAG: hypothetical protein FWG59_02920 [Betaproteobacteria bacterium]|nr:hypothetical protein [Betaproteobacteria bacterium]
MWLFATLSPGYAAPPAAQQKTHKLPSKNATRPGWDFQVPDRSFQNARWRESISATLRQTTFAPSSPAGRYLQKNATIPGSRLPPAQIGELDKMRPPETQQGILGEKASIHGEFTKESTGWHPYNGPADITGNNSTLREERRAGAYADLHPSEDVEFQLGPECYLGGSALRPEQTGRAKDTSATLGMGMKMKIDF